MNYGFIEMFYAHGIGKHGPFAWTWQEYLHSIEIQLRAAKTGDGIDFIFALDNEKKNLRKDMSKVPTLVDEPKISQDGLNVVLECQTEANPAPEAVWTKDGKEIKEGDDYTFSQQTLPGDKYKIRCEIHSFSKPLAGVYKCLLKNDHGQSTATFTVTAGDAPEFIEKPHIIQKDGGKTLIIKVKVKSKIEASIKWTKGDVEVKTNDRISTSSKKDEKDAESAFYFLEIKDPVKEDEAKYTCTASNAEGSASQSLNLVFD